ncbi:Esterase TesA [Gammaproteobacteria bacterium]
MAQTLAQAAPVVLVLGDSLSAAYGLRPEQGWVALLEQRLASRASPLRVVNRSLSGDTTAGGLYRLTQALAEAHPGWVIVELGANDGLRGLSPDLMVTNLTALIRLAQTAGAEVLLTGMEIPPNYGRPYSDRFRAVFPQVAQATGATLVPFLLAGVALNPALFLEDGLHPNAEAQPRILENIWIHLEPRLPPNPFKPAG